MADTRTLYLFSTSESKCMLLLLAQANVHIAVVPALHQIDIMGKHMDSAQSLVHKHLDSLPVPIG